jgi:hypothetical protein
MYVFHVAVCSHLIRLIDCMFSPPEQGLPKPKHLRECINKIVIKYMLADFKVIYLALNE